MKLSPRILLLVALAVGGVALAVPSLTRILNLQVQSTLVVGTNAQAGTTSNAITRTLAPSAQLIDFGTVDAGTALDSAAITVTGAQLNDPCFVSQPVLLDGGTDNDVVEYACYVSAVDAVKVRARQSLNSTQQNPPAQIFNLRVISNQ